MSEGGSQKADLRRLLSVLCPDLLLRHFNHVAVAQPEVGGRLRVAAIQYPFALFARHWIAACDFHVSEVGGSAEQTSFIQDW